jgi:hypothetical protein
MGINSGGRLQIADFRLQVAGNKNKKSDFRLEV